MSDTTTLTFHLPDTDARYVIDWLRRYRELARLMRREPHHHTARFQELWQHQQELAQDISDVLEGWPWTLGPPGATTARQDRDETGA